MALFIYSIPQAKRTREVPALLNDGSYTAVTLTHALLCKFRHDAKGESLRIEMCFGYFEDADQPDPQKFVTEPLPRRYDRIDGDEYNAWASDNPDYTISSVLEFFFNRIP